MKPCYTHWKWNFWVVAHQTWVTLQIKSIKLHKSRQCATEEKNLSLLCYEKVQCCICITFVTGKNDLIGLCKDLLVDIGVWVIRQDMILGPQNLHCFLRIFFQLKKRKRKTPEFRHAMQWVVIKLRKKLPLYTISSLTRYSKNSPVIFHDSLRTNLFLRLRCFKGKVSKQVNKLGGFTSICRQLRPNGPSQFQQHLLLRFTGVPTKRLTCKWYSFSFE